MVRETPFCVVDIPYFFLHLFKSYTLFSSVWYGVVLPVKTEMGSLRVALELQISETEWAQARFDQLNLLDEKRLRAADHVQAY